MAIHNWITALSYIQRGRNRTARTVPSIRSTSVVMRGDNGPDGPDAVAIRYHETDVVTYHRDGPAILDSGGWRTATTKTRMCDYGPVPVWQERGLWYVGGTGAIYFDGIQIDPATGAILNARPVPDQRETERAKRKIDRLVRDYIAGYIADCRERGALPMPGPGDCFYCSMRTTESDVPLGDASGDVSHILSHLTEPYYVPALLYNAIRDRGYGAGPGPIYAMANADLQSGRKLDRPGDLWAVRESLQAYFHNRKIALVECYRGPSGPDGEGGRATVN